MERKRHGRSRTVEAEIRTLVQTIQGFHQTYTVKSGDNLSKISERFCGSPNHYPKIAEASNISDPNKIRVGEQITIPVLA